MARFTLLSGCSGGGKSTLLRGLAAAGFATVDEPGRRIVAQERAGDGAALPWIDPLGFARRAVAVAKADLDAARALEGRVFFDRGLGDALAALAHASGCPPPEAATLARWFDRRVFVVPPWAEIYRTDGERQHPFAEAVAEYHRLRAFYETYGFTVVMVPKTPPAPRVAFIRAQLGE